jgi:hypothetical protein
MADDIKIRIGLEGDAEIKKKLDSVRDVGTKAGEEISKSLNRDVGKKSGDEASSVSTGGLGKAIGAEESLERNRVGVERFRQAVHTLHPVLDEAGIGIGNLGAFARLAGGGFGALAAAVGGSILVGLAKLRDEAEKTKRELDIIAGGTGAAAGGGPGEKGSGLFEAWKKDADEFGATLKDVLPLAQQLTELKAKQDAAQRSGGQVFSSAFKQADLPPGAIRLPDGGPVSDEQNRGALRATIAAGRLDRTTPEDAAKQMAELIGAANSGKGVLTEDLLDPHKLAPSLGSAITTSLRDSGIISGNIRTTPQLQESIKSGQTEVRGDQIVPALARDEGKFRAQADQLPITFTEAVAKTEAQVKQLGDRLGEAGVKVLEFVGRLEHQALDKGENPVTPPLVKDQAGDIAKSTPLSFAPPSRPHTASESEGGILNERGSAIADILSHAGQGLAIIAKGAATSRGEISDKPPIATVQQSPVTTGPPSEAAPVLQRPDVPPNPAVVLPPAAAAPAIPATAAAPPLAAPQAPPGAVAAPPVPATNVPRNEAAAPAQPPQAANLGSTLLDSIIKGIAGLTRNKDTTVTDPVAIGIRGEAAPVGDDATRKVADLGTAAGDAAKAAEEAAAKLRDIQAPSTPAEAPPVAHAAKGGRVIRMAEGGEARLDVSAGGHLSGPGTGKSDSIKADVSNNEFVVNAEDAAKNLPLLHDINSGKVKDGHYVGGGQVHPPSSDGTHFAEGGSVKSDSDKDYDREKRMEALRSESASIEEERAKLGAQYQANVDKLNAPEKVNVKPGTERPKPSIKSPFTTTGTGFDGAIDVRAAADIAANDAWEKANTSVVHSDADKILQRHNYAESSVNLKNDLEDQQAKLGERQAKIQKEYDDLSYTDWQRRGRPAPPGFAEGGLVGNSSAARSPVGHFAEGGSVGSPTRSGVTDVTPDASPSAAILRHLVSRFADGGGAAHHFAEGGSLGSSPPSTETRFREVISRFNGGVIGSAPASRGQTAASHEGENAGHFAAGGFVGDSPAVAAFRTRLGAMGFADGGIVDAPQFELPEMPSLAPLAAHGDNAFSPALSVDRLNMLHPIPIHFPGFGVIDGVHATPSAVKQLAAASIDAQMFSTGKKPAWYGGGNG